MVKEGFDLNCLYAVFSGPQVIALLICIHFFVMGWRGICENTHRIFNRTLLKYRHIQSPGTGQAVQTDNPGRSDLRALGKGVTVHGGGGPLLIRKEILWDTK